LIKQDATNEVRRTREAVSDDGHQRLVIGNHGGTGIKADRIGNEPIAAGDHQGIILANIIGLRGDGIDVHPASHHRDRVVLAELRINPHGWRKVNILDIVHHVQVGDQIGIPRLVKLHAGSDVIAVVNEVRVVEIGNNQIQVVDELNAGNRIAGRVGPDKRDAQGIPPGGGRQRNFIGAGLAGCQRVGGILVNHDHGIGRGTGIGQRSWQRGG